MSMDAIQKVTETERSGQDRKAEAAAAAKKLVADAQRAGEALLEETRREVEAENKALLKQAEERAAKAAAKALEEAETQAKAMCQAAESKLDAAAELIVRRVVNR